MFRRDTSAQFEIGLISRRFRSGKLLSRQKLWPKAYQDLLQKQGQEPVAVCRNPANSRTYWMFQDEFYWDDEGYSSVEVMALILDRQRKHQKRLDRAVALMNGATSQSAQKRDSIPEDIQAFVWNRDGGRCIKCGSQEHLEFDHIIPVSRGGSNTARNLQVLCEACNRSKGASIG